MTYLQAIIYGLIQGLCEFLPISSSGHLALLPNFMQIKDPGVSFDLFLHMGTSFSVFIYFRKDYIRLLKDGVRFIQRKNKKLGHELKLYLFSTISTCLLALCLKSLSETYGRNVLFISANLVVFGLVLYLVDRLSKSSIKRIEQIKTKDSIIIGLMQALAIFPGVSRSGITVTAARKLGLDRKLSAKYSFMLSLPLILLGMILMSNEAFEKISEVGMDVSIIGLLTSFVTGILAIKLFLKLFTSIGLLPFVLYRVFIGIILLLYYI